MNVYFTVDVEQDCPPYLNTWRGVEEGMQACPGFNDLLEHGGGVAVLVETQPEPLGGKSPGGSRDSGRRVRLVAVDGRL